MFFKVIACEIALREICYLAALCPNTLELEFLTVGWHSAPERGRVVIQQHIDAVPEGRFDAILIGYGLCSNMLVGITARHTPLVIPRAHDCITFFLGSKERYQREYTAHPGTYYYTAGWLEFSTRRGKGMDEQEQNGAGRMRTYQELVERYGEEAAQYVMEVMGKWTKTYDRGALIKFDFTSHLPLAEQVRAICQRNGWQYVELLGDLSLLRRWLAGEWDEDDFLYVPPNYTVRATYDEGIIAAHPLNHTEKER